MEFTWRRRLFMWEEEVLLSLREDLEGMRLTSHEDVWRWKLEDKGVFSVKLAYLKLEGLVLHEDVWREEEKGVFSNLWKSPVPSKVVAFAWRALVNRIPTKLNLVLRNALGPDELSMCTLCNRMEESTTHLFLHCDMASLVWSKLMSWINYFFLPLRTSSFIGSVGVKEGEIIRSRRGFG
jgi:hypothetical protein